MVTALRPKVIVPNGKVGLAFHETNLGVANYRLDQLYSPDTELEKSIRLDLVPPLDITTFYSANGGYRVYDRSRYRNHGTISGATWKRDSSGLWVTNHDGVDDYLNCGTSTTLDLQPAWHYSCWIKLDVIDRINSFVAKWFGTGNQYGYLFRVNSSNYLELWSSDDGAAPLDTLTASTTPLTARKWTYVAFNNSKMYVGVDGVLTEQATSGALAASFFASNRSCIIGTNEDAIDSTNTLDGQLIFEFMATSLSVAQMTDWYNRTRQLLGV